MFCHITAAAAFPIFCHSWCLPVWKHTVTIFIWALMYLYFCPVTGLKDQRLQCLILCLCRSRQADKYAEYSFSCSTYWSFTHTFQTSPSSKAPNGCPNRTLRQRERNASIDFTAVCVWSRRLKYQYDRFSNLPGTVMSLNEVFQLWIMYRTNKWNTAAVTAQLFSCRLDGTLSVLTLDFYRYTVYSSLCCAL